MEPECISAQWKQECISAQWKQECISIYFCIMKMHFASWNHTAFLHCGFVDTLEYKLRSLVLLLLNCSSCSGMKNLVSFINIVILFSLLECRQVSTAAVASQACVLVLQVVSMGKFGLNTTVVS